MKLKELFNDKKKILKFTIIVVGISVIGLLSVIGMTYATSVPKFCALCHIMKPEFATWEASAHSQVSCVDCHVDSGLVNALKHKVVATQELYMYVSKTYELPIRATEPIPDSRCLKCHSLNRKVSASTDLNVPHQRHHDNGVACVKCHEGVAHGKIASSGQTMDGNFSQWTKTKGTGIMTPQNTRPKMDLCMDCHGRRGVTVACEACHSGSMKPQSHLENSFKTGHGKLAKKDIKYCDTCHAFIKAPGVVSKDLFAQDVDEDPVAKYLDSMQVEAGSANGYADYAKTNEFCVDCHKKRPPTHNDNWPFNHGKEADKDEQRCMVCHSPRTDVKGVTAKAACSSCHPSIHANVPWRVGHPIEIPPKLAILPPKCFQCHVKDMCAGCHRTQGGNQQNDKKAPQSNADNSLGGENLIDGNTPQGGVQNGPPGGTPPVSSPPISSNKPAPQAKVTIKTGIKVRPPTTSNLQP